MPDTERDNVQSPHVPSKPVAQPSEGEGKKKKQNPHPYRWLKRLGQLIFKIGALLTIGSLIWMYVGQVYISHDNSMYPHVKDGDLIITYKLESLFNGDLVLYRRGNTLKVGRIIARDGDVVEIGEDSLYLVNGNMPMENMFYETLPDTDSEITYPYVVQEGSFFIMNDMREIMNDSRTIGSISGGDIQGKIVLIIRHRGM